MNEKTMAGFVRTAFGAMAEGELANVPPNLAKTVRGPMEVAFHEGVQFALVLLREHLSERGQQIAAITQQEIEMFDAQFEQDAKPH